MYHGPRGVPRPWGVPWPSRGVPWPLYEEYALEPTIMIYCHSRLTHAYLLSGEDQPTCTKCDTVLRVKHILLDCPELRDIRLKYFTASSLKDIFESVDNQSIIGFDAHFYNQL